MAPEYAASTAITILAARVEVCSADILRQACIWSGSSRDQRFESVTTGVQSVPDDHESSLGNHAIVFLLERRASVLCDGKSSRKNADMLVAMFSSPSLGSSLAVELRGRECRT